MKQGESLWPFGHKYGLMENTHEASFYLYGADEGDRTLVPSLGSSYSTTELHPHVVVLIKYIKYTSPL